MPEKPPPGTSGPKRTVAARLHIALNLLASGALALYTATTRDQIKDLLKEAAKEIDDLRSKLESAKTEVGDFIKPTSGDLAAAIRLISLRCAHAEQVNKAGVNNINDAWMALQMIRETVETLGPVGAVQGQEYVATGVAPTFAAEAEAIIAGIIKLVPEQAHGAIDAVMLDAWACEKINAQSHETGERITYNDGFAQGVIHVASDLRNMCAEAVNKKSAKRTEPCPYDGCEEVGYCDGRHCVAAGGALRYDEDLDGPRTAWYEAYGANWKPTGWRWGINTLLRRKSGAWWEGHVVGFYGTEQTERGYAVQLHGHAYAPVQLHPESELEEM